MGELRPSLPTEQAVDRKISLNVVDEDQMGILVRKPGLFHNRGDHLLSAALDDALCHAGVRVVIRVEQMMLRHGESKPWHEQRVSGNRFL